MNKFAFLLALSASFVTISFAQTPAPQVVGVVTRVDGLVTVGQNNALSNASQDGVIMQNARVVTTGTGTISIRLNNGCVIPLKPNQAVTIDSRRECQAILDSIQPVGPVGVAGAGGGVGAVEVRDALIIGVGALTSFLVIRSLSGS